jgi:hypothetical protein
MKYLAMVVLAALLGLNAPSTFAAGPEHEKHQCGGIAGIPCADDTEYCEMKTGTCQIADNMGHCKKKPEICTDHIEYVYGCDGKTYGNPCEAAMKGMSIDHKGECRSKPGEDDNWSQRQEKKTF